MEMLKVKSTHDLIRESIDEKAQTPAATTEAGERAESQKLVEDKNLSKGAMPSFQFGQAEDIPRMPRLSGMAVRVSRCAHPCPAPIQKTNNADMRREMGEIRRSRMSEEDQAAFYGMLGDIRSETIMLLECLIQYDDLISTDGANFLHKAMLSIRAVDGGK